MSYLCNSTKGWIACGTLAVLLVGFSPTVATAQSEVKGSGIIITSRGVAEGGNYFRHIAVNAWLDENGVAHGTMTWEGDAFQPLPHGNIEYGPVNPYIFDVTDIVFDGNTAYVFGIVIASPEDNANGIFYGFSFTDNSDTDEPDAIDGVSVDAGSIRLK